MIVEPRVVDFTVRLDALQVLLEGYMSTTTDRSDPRLSHGPDEEPVAQNEVYLVSPDIVFDPKGYVRPVRRTYVHTTCGGETTMAPAIAETYARDPKFYGGTYCVKCQMHRPVAEFTWDPDGSVVGS